ncbi:unnamed protein product [Eruca vesicaria subsp. sativa]|uniref:C2 domain-containing protein n=1 Tax=Eruca vesicaria subsp. sativa TaxID=29727 RepID=A0ABC8M5N0_ERUVS|nr:unnamed protein product [Eruca vesicaria subsp. sativa]
MMSSDPYVVLNLGKQKLQTTVGNSNLNPVRNQELMLYVPETVKLIGKWLKPHDNPLIDDSIIIIVDGKLRQEVQIELQNVKSNRVLS